VSIVTAAGINLAQVVINADAATLHVIFDGERPLSPAVDAASAAPIPDHLLCDGSASQDCDWYESKRNTDYGSPKKYASAR